MSFHKHLHPRTGPKWLSLWVTAPVSRGWSLGGGLEPCPSLGAHIGPTGKSFGSPFKTCPVTPDGSAPALLPVAQAPPCACLAPVVPSRPLWFTLHPEARKSLRKRPDTLRQHVPVTPGTCEGSPGAPDPSSGLSCDHPPSGHSGLSRPQGHCPHAPVPGARLPPGQHLYCSPSFLGVAPPETTSPAATLPTPSLPAFTRDTPAS